MISLMYKAYKTDDCIFTDRGKGIGKALEAEKECLIGSTDTSRKIPVAELSL